MLGLVVGLLFATNAGYDEFGQIPPEAFPHITGIAVHFDRAQRGMMGTPSVIDTTKLLQGVFDTVGKNIALLPALTVLDLYGTFGAKETTLIKQFQDSHAKLPVNTKQSNAAADPDEGEPGFIIVQFAEGYMPENTETEGGNGKN